MKVVIVAALLGFMLAAVSAGNPQACNPVQDCTSSIECATSGGGLNCRCSWFNCKDYGTETCGGSCTLDSQCAQWAGGDESCICTWAFECERESRTKEPGYELYMKTMMAIKKDRIAKRLATLTKELKQQEAILDERLRHM